MNGRIFKLVLDPSNPLAGTLSVLWNADAGGYNNPARSTSRTTWRPPRPDC
jgi:hypothetical protein